MADITAIISNYNSRDTLHDCLLNLEKLRARGDIVDIIVVDGNSPDKAADMVAEKHPKVKLLALKENKGIAYTFNRGVEKSKSEWLLFLGSDAFPKEGDLPKMVEYLAEKPKIGIATAKLITRSGAEDKDAHRGFPTPWVAITHFTKLGKIFGNTRLFGSYFMRYKDMTAPHEIDMCISHFMLLKRSVFDAVGGFDEDYFVYGEDVDFCYRVKQAGYQNWYLPQFTAIHYKGVSVGLRKETKDISKASQETKLRMSKESVRAARLFYQKHYTKRYPRILTGLVLLGISLTGQIKTLKIKLGY